MPHGDAEYRRYTAALREGQRKYAISPARHPRGKAVVEIEGDKGLLRCTVKNLVPRGAGFGYGVWLVDEDSEQGFPVQAGIIEINKEGYGESNWSFEVSSVKKTGLDIDSFITLEVRAHTAQGYKPGERVLRGQLELAEVTLPEEPKMEKVSPFGTGLPYYQWWKFYPGYFQNLMHYPAQQTYDSQADKHREKQACSGKPSEIGSGPAFQGHQLVGLQYDDKGAVKFLVHGIPGRFCLRDQPYGGATGYVYWHPLPGQQYRAGDYGYWLIHVDPATGEVVFPQKATKPPSCDQCKRKSL